jgi:hypothetical protein
MAVPETYRSTRPNPANTSQASSTRLFIVIVVEGDPTALALGIILFPFTASGDQLSQHAKWKGCQKQSQPFGSQLRVPSISLAEAATISRGAV